MRTPTCLEIECCVWLRSKVGVVHEVNKYICCNLLLNTTLCLEIEYSLMGLGRQWPVSMLIATWHYCMSYLPMWWKVDAGYLWSVCCVVKISWRDVGCIALHCIVQELCASWSHFLLPFVRLETRCSLASHELGLTFSRAQTWPRMVVHLFASCPLCLREKGGAIGNHHGWIPLPGFPRLVIFAFLAL